MWTQDTRPNYIKLRSWICMSGPSLPLPPRRGIHFLFRVWPFIIKSWLCVWPHLFVFLLSVIKIVHREPVSEKVLQLLSKLTESGRRLYSHLLQWSTECTEYLSIAFKWPCICTLHPVYTPFNNADNKLFFYSSVVPFTQDCWKRSSGKSSP